MRQVGGAASPPTRPLPSRPMKRTTKRISAALFASFAAFAALAPVASAEITGGEGTYGPTTDLTVTYFGFAIIIMFPLITVILSVLQHRKEEREEAAHEALHKREDLAEWHGGW